MDYETKVDKGSRIDTQLKCSACTKFCSRIDSMQNFSHQWIIRAESMHTSNICDHVQSEQHLSAMLLFNHELQGLQDECSSAIASALIVVALNSLSNDERTRLQLKFDIAYFVAKERLSFRKYPAICELEARHRVSIERAYMNEIAAGTFVHFIAKATRQKMVFQLRKSNFFLLF